MFGIYIHWPFCLSKCIYCDFDSQVLTKKDANDTDFQQEYCNCCIKQLRYFAKKIQNNTQTQNNIHGDPGQKEVSSIYFGGGTPSLLKPEVVKNILTEIKNLFVLKKDCEVTLEANPTSFEVEKFHYFHDFGINRLSLGVQSFNNKNLSWLGRQHSAEQAIIVVNEIKNIFPRWNFDLIYGLPRQTIDEWLKELKLALSLEPQHLSLYTLIVDPDTPLGAMVKNGIIIPKTNDEMADFYDATHDLIENTPLNKKYAKKIEQYEVSNYSIPGFESKHNCCYWNSYDYMGIGPNAHGRLTYIDGKRYEILCIQETKKWLESIKNNQNGLQVERPLFEQEQVEEILLMGLRTFKGIDIDDISSRFGININKYLNIDKINELKKQKLLKNPNNKTLKLTYNGIKILDAILCELF